MDRQYKITLIQNTYTTDLYGVQRPTEKTVSIFAAVDSVTLTEMAEGGRLGLNPDIRFTVFAPEYNGEQVIAYNGKRYGVYRTYNASNDLIELYCERKGGDNV